MVVALLVPHQRVTDCYQDSQQHHKRYLQLRRYRLLEVPPLAMQLHRSLLVMTVPPMSMLVLLVFVVVSMGEVSLSGVAHD